MQRRILLHASSQRACFLHVLGRPFLFRRKQARLHGVRDIAPYIARCSFSEPTHVERSVREVSACILLLLFYQAVIGSLQLLRLRVEYILYSMVTNIIIVSAEPFNAFFRSKNPKLRAALLPFSLNIRSRFFGCL